MRRLESRSRFSALEHASTRNPIRSPATIERNAEEKRLSAKVRIDAIITSLQLKHNAPRWPAILTARYRSGIWIAPRGPSAQRSLGTNASKAAANFW